MHHKQIPVVRLPRRLNSNNTFSNVYGFCRSFSISASRPAKALPPRPKLDDKDITGSYLKGSGPGGQKINKTNSAVQLIHKPTGIVVKSQATRSRSQNQKLAREILAEKVDLIQSGQASRTAIKTALKQKRKASKAKKSRRKYRALEEEKTKMKMETSMGVEKPEKALNDSGVRVREQEEEEDDLSGKETWEDVDEEVDIDKTVLQPQQRNTQPK